MPRLAVPAGSEVLVGVMDLKPGATGLLESDGKRFLFAVEAWDAKDKIAEGRA